MGTGVLPNQKPGLHGNSSRIKEVHLRKLGNFEDFPKVISFICGDALHGKALLWSGGGTWL